MSSCLKTDMSMRAKICIDERREETCSSAAIKRHNILRTYEDRVPSSWCGLRDPVASQGSVLDNLSLKFRLWKNQSIKSSCILRRSHLSLDRGLKRRGSRISRS